MVVNPVKAIRGKERKKRTLTGWSSLRMIGLLYHAKKILLAKDHQSVMCILNLNE